VRRPRADVSPLLHLSAADGQSNVSDGLKAEFPSEPNEKGQAGDPDELGFRMVVSTCRHPLEMWFWSTPDESERHQSNGKARSVDTIWPWGDRRQACRLVRVAWGQGGSRCWYIGTTGRRRSGVYPL